MTDTNASPPRPSHTDTKHRQAFLLLVTGACVIGAAPILVRLAEAGPAAIGFWRLALSLPLLAVLARRSADGVGRASGLAVLAGLAFALDLGFWHYGIANTSVAKATVLTNLTPLVVTTVVWIFFKQRPTRLFLLAVALAIAGAWILATSKSVGTVGPNPPLGDALSLTTALWYALYFLTMSAARQRSAAARAMFWSSLTGGVALLLAAVFLGEPIMPATTAGWAACAALGVVHAVGQGSIAWALGRLPPARASVMVLLQPVVATILGWVVFSERFSAWQAVGAAIALGGVLLAQWASRSRLARTTV